MTIQELFYLLRQYGEEIARTILNYDNNSLKCVNEGMRGRLAEYVEKDPQGLTQPSSMLGHMRAINLNSALSRLGFESDIFNKKSIGTKSNPDLTVEGVESECRGSLAHANNSYGPIRGGKYSIPHDKRLYFLIKEKVAIDICEMVSLRFQILYIDSSKFVNSKSKKVNISQLKQICPEDVIGEWEVFNDERS